MGKWEVVKVFTGRSKPWRAFSPECKYVAQTWCQCKSFHTWAEAMAHVAQVTK